MSTTLRLMTFALILQGCTQATSPAPVPAQASAMAVAPAQNAAKLPAKVTGDGPACIGGVCGGKDDPTAVKPSAPAQGAAIALEGTKYGEGVTLTESVSMAQLLAEPNKWEGKRVRVEGEVTDVCQMRGCWFEMAGAQPGEKMRFKVVDGVMTFPTSAKGNFAVAEGTVRKIPLTLEQTKKALAHEAEETGKTFDPDQVKEPMTIVRLDGTGAVLRAKK